MTKYLKRASTVKAGCAALAAVCFRQSDNAKQVVLECKGATVITVVMEFHAAHRRTQGTAASAIRNIVSRDKELIAAILGQVHCTTAMHYCNALLHCTSSTALHY